MHDIHEWWPRLSIASKHAIEEHQHDELPEEVRSEIQDMTGETVPRGTRLSASDLDFIRTQNQQVD